MIRMRFFEIIERAHFGGQKYVRAHHNRYHNITRIQKKNSCNKMNSLISCNKKN